MIDRTDAFGVVFGALAIYSVRFNSFTHCEYTFITTPTFERARFQCKEPFFHIIK